VIPAGSSLSIARRLATPYGLALVAIFTDFLAGGAAGIGVQPLFRVLHTVTSLMVAVWLLAVVLAIRRQGLLGLIALPSVLIAWAIDGHPAPDRRLHAGT
jgi:hypothetical protein